MLLYKYSCGLQVSEQVGCKQMFHNMNEPCLEIMVLFVLHTPFSNAHVQPSCRVKCLIFGWTLRLLPYFMCANSKGSGETARLPSLSWAFAGRLCDKYHNLMSWLKCYSINFSVYINHRPAFGLDPMKLVKAFETLGLPTDKGNAIDRGDLLDLLQTKGVY